MLLRCEDVNFKLLHSKVTMSFLLEIMDKVYNYIITQLAE